MHTTSGLFLVVLLAIAWISVVTSLSSSKHLIVLVHGLMGNERDLEYLGDRLSAVGDCVVLRSASNANYKSLQGVRLGAERLIEEIREVKKAHKDLEKISFVGNSLGGIFCRYALKLLSYHTKEGEKMLYLDEKNSLLPLMFITIATPHLGVRDNLYIEDRIQRLLRNEKLAIPTILKRAAGKALGASGIELFLDDKQNITDALLVDMAHKEEYLKPLRMFKVRVLYSNLDNDFVVSLNTAAFLPNDLVKSLREEFIYGVPDRGKARIVKTITTTTMVDLVKTRENKCIDLDDSQGIEDLYSGMMASLDSLGWTKHVYYFPGTFPYYPLAHNKLAALRKTPSFLFNGILGFDEGEVVMNSLAQFLSEAESKY